MWIVLQQSIELLEQGCYDSDVAAPGKVPIYFPWLFQSEQSKVLPEYFSYSYTGVDTFPDLLLAAMGLV